MSELREKLQAAHQATYDFGNATHELGADAEGVPDLEPWDGEDGEPLSGEHGVSPSGFMPDIGGPPTPTEDVQAQQIDPLPVDVIVDRPSDWVTIPYALTATVAKRIAPLRPGRYSLLITNMHETEDVMIGPSEMGCQRTIKPGQSHEANHSAEVYAKGVDGLVEVDESFSVIV